MRTSILLIFIFAATCVSAQTNNEKIKTKWVVGRFDAEKNTPQVTKAKQDLQGVCLSFGEEELVISKKTDSGDSVIKKGKYFISGNTLTLGKDNAEISELSEKHLTIKVSGQGILYLTRL
jgi:hypothetical protein